MAKSIKLTLTEDEAEVAVDALETDLYGEVESARSWRSLSRFD
jgi:hypothetical protein